MKAIIIAEDFAGMRAQGRDWLKRPVWSGISGLCASILFGRVFRRVTGPLHCAGSIPSGFPKTQASSSVSVGQGRHRQGRCPARGLPVVQIQNPRMPVSKFDLVIANTHDGISGPNVLISRNALHPVTPQKLAAARTEWEERLKQDARPLLSILVGGANGRFSLGPGEAERMADGIITFTKHNAMQAVLTPPAEPIPLPWPFFANGWSLMVLPF